MLPDLLPFIQLGATGVLALGLLTVVKDNQKRAAEREAKIVTILDNHMGEIAANQARTAHALDLIVGRLLDAVIVPKTIAMPGTKTTVSVTAEGP